jgi:hypothetical protein
MAGICEEGFVIPMIVLFYNDAATDEILESKRKMRLELAAIQQRSHMMMRLPWYAITKRLSGYLTSLRDRIAIFIGVWRNEPPKGAIDLCLGSPEFEFLKHLHKLTDRMAVWNAFPDKDKGDDELPKEFVDLKGPLDAPLSAYRHLCHIQKEADAFIPAELQRTMFAVMLMKIMRRPENLPSSQEEYVGRLNSLLCDFGARFSDIVAINEQASATELLKVKPKWWKRMLPSFLRRHFTTEFGDVLNFVATLDENEVIKITSDALGGTIPSHRDFKARHRDASSAPMHAVASGNVKAAGATNSTPNLLETSRCNNMPSTNLVKVVIDRPSPGVVDENLCLPPPFDEEDFTNLVEVVIDRPSPGVVDYNFANLYPPPPFDEEDFKLAQRREEKAAARAALKQSSLSATVALGSTQPDAKLHRRSSAVDQPSDPPPPFDEEDFKLAQRREKKAAARAGRRLEQC